MNPNNRFNLLLGVLLIVFGGWWLAAQFVPALQPWGRIAFTWPLIIIGVGLFLLAIGFLTGTAEMAIPACIVGGIGGLLFYQNATGNWGSWAYAWALIPGFVGVGVALAGFLKGRGWGAMRDGLGLIVISLVLFVIFGAFLGGGHFLAGYWPILLILLGLWILFRPFRRKA